MSTPPASTPAPLVVRGPGQGLRPREHLWPAGHSIVRAHPSEFGSTEFDRREDANARFSPVRPAGLVQGVLYGASGHNGAASETVFHTVPAPEPASPERRPRQVALGPYKSWVWSVLVCRRDLRLVDLDDAGLTDLGTTRDELVLSGRLDYPVTRQWSLALWHAAPWADGLLWSSRQDPGSAALMLFEKRDDRRGGVERRELSADGPPDPLFYPEGLERLYQLATRLDITIVV